MWGLRKADVKGLNSFHRRMLRRLCGIHWLRKISNQKLYSLTGVTPMMATKITPSRWKTIDQELPTQINDILFHRRAKVDKETQRKKNNYLYNNTE